MERGLGVTGEVRALVPVLVALDIAAHARVQSLPECGGGDEQRLGGEDRDDHRPHRQAERVGAHGSERQAD